MTIPTPELTDLNKKVRDKLQPLLHEKAVMGYAFSYSKLLALLTRMGAEDPNLEISKCILAVDSKSEDEAKSKVNDKIAAIYSEEELKSLRSEDPFGRRMDYMIYESTTPARLNSTKLVEIAPSLGISTKKALELVAKATTPGSPYVAVVARAVKEGKGE